MTDHTTLEIETYQFADDGIVPNNPSLSLVVYRNAFDDEKRDGESVAARFAEHGWPDAWADGIYPHHHYHSTAHEVLGIARGWARVRFGAGSGRTVEVKAGDVVVIPAGVAHRREAASNDLLVIGAYPLGQQPDICPAEIEERRRAIANIAVVPLPAADPVTGRDDPLLELWRLGG